MKPGTLDDIIRMWRTDLKGKNNNSYKFVLQDSILNAIQIQENTVNSQFIFDNFIRTYWNNSVVYKFREANSPNQEPLVIQSINTVSKNNGLDGITLKDVLKRKKWNESELIKAVQLCLKSDIRSFLQNPISRLQNDSSTKNKKGNGDISGSGWLYEWDMKNDTIILNEPLTKIISDHIELFRILTLMAYTEYIEPFNLTPSILSKLLGETNRKAIPTTVKKIIREYAKDNCFYCSKEVLNPEYDHFIPFAYVNHCEPWNLVCCCKECNRGKFGKFEKLPERNMIEKLVERNSQLQEFYSTPNLFVLGHSTIQEVYEQAYKSGYKEWEKQRM